MKSENLGSNHATGHARISASGSVEVIWASVVVGVSASV